MNAVKSYRYNPQIFIFPFWKEIYETDSERKQDTREAEETFYQLKSAYESLGYQTCILPQIPVNQRTDFILEQVRHPFSFWRKIGRKGVIPYGQKFSVLTPDKLNLFVKIYAYSINIGVFEKIIAYMDGRIKINAFLYTHKQNEFILFYYQLCCFLDNHLLSSPHCHNRPS